jgi:hypothetical protein
MQLDAIMGCARRINGFQAHKAANAVIDVDDEVTRCQTSRFCNDILRALRTTRLPDQTIPQNILFTNND